MIIEPAIHVAMMRLMDRRDCSKLYEQHFSYVLASSCEDILKEFQTLSSSNLVAVELPYPSGKGICDIVIDLSSLRFSNEIYQHQIHCECKFFRKGPAHQGLNYNLGSVWEDFTQVVNSGKGISYSAILCENEWDKLILRNDASINCFAAQSPSNFNLYKISAPPKSEDIMNINGPGTKFHVLRNYTEAFNLKFGNETRLFRIYLFRLWVKDINSDDFQFEELK